MASSSFQVNDPVHVIRENKPLEGVVAYIGSVDFDAADDWIGVRLTGVSVGLGKNDGTVQGKQYFECPPQCGLFVKESSLAKRTLSKLEELRLRRELASSSSASATTTNPATTASAVAAARSPGTPRTVTTSITSATDARTRLEEIRQRKVSSSADSSLRQSTKEKLDEIRQRRALVEKKEEHAESSRDDSTERNTALQAELDELKSKLSELESKLSNKENECSELQSKLSSALHEASQAKEKVAELETAKLKSSTPAKVSMSPEELQDQVLSLQRENDELRDQSDEASQEISSLKQALERERKSHSKDIEEMTKAKSESAAYQKELQALADQQAQRGASDASQYKERAKLQAELSTMRRKVEQLEKEKTELEANIEDITLDKEQLQEEKEALEDRMEELKIDTETAQMEAEELRLELEDARASSERLAVSGDSSAGDEAEDKVQSLSVQNMRLREAIIRLREQSSVEKVELTRQLRSLEKNAEDGKALIGEVEALRALKDQHLEQINDLKDMVEHGAAFEGMVEDLSDRVLSLEEDNIALQTTLREMEEAAELTAEMEEVQAEEIKSMSRELEERDAIIRNLEEAIKMQRRREDDFRRTVGNYRTTVEILKQEKKALLDLQQGGEGEKNNIVAASQKALARAAQLVSDAAAMRKREAQATRDRVNYLLHHHLSTRLESLFPQNAAASEVSAMKGELTVSKVIGFASSALHGISKSFSSTIRPSLQAEDVTTDFGVGTHLKLPDETKARVSNMLHQAEFSQIIVDVSSELIRLLCAGQWPDFLSPDESRDLGILLGNSVSNLDMSLAVVLRTLQEEGVLTPEQSNVQMLRQAVKSTMQSIRSGLERENGALIHTDWCPPAWKLLKEVAFAKFACMGVTATLSILANPDDDGFNPILSNVYNTLEQSCSQAISLSLRLASLDERNDRLVSELEGLVTNWRASSEILLEECRKVVLQGTTLEPFFATVDKMGQDLSKVASAVRMAHLNPKDDESAHPLSPEVTDPWSQLSQLARSVRSAEGDPEDVNYLVRARWLEHRLEEAVENEPKLALATSKIAVLEKNLASRTKEISMQSARLSELERLLAKSNSSGRGRLADSQTSQELATLREENRVLMEAMDVLQRQVDEYENEIRAMRDFKSPSRPSGARTPRRTVTSPIPSSMPRNDDANVNGGAIEATLFRPALQHALREVADWKAAVVGTSLLGLPPLQFGFSTSDESKTDAQADAVAQLNAALGDLRIEKASIRIVDLRNQKVSPRQQLRVQKEKYLHASERLESALLRCAV